MTNTVNSLPVLLLALTIGAFAIGLDTFVVIGSLAEISRSLAISIDAAGWIISTYAFCYAVFAPLNAWLFRGWKRRNVLLLSTCIFTIGNLLCAIGLNFEMVILGRVVSAFGAAMFTPAATTLTTVLLPPERKGFALSLIFGGMTVSQAVGVPVTSWIAEAFGWRYAFYFVTLFGLIALMLLTIILSGISHASPQIKKQALQMDVPKVIYGLLSVTFMIVAAEFVVYSYLSVLLSDTKFGIIPVLPSVLFAYGVGAVVGNIATGYLTDRIGPANVLLGAILTQTGLLIALVTLRDNGPLVIGIGLLWGIVSYMYLVPIQHRLLSYAGKQSSIFLAINSSIIYIGIGAGGWIGGLLLTRLGIPFLAIFTGIVGLSALASAVIVMRRPVNNSATGDALSQVS
ncbi:TPA: MFS transporter [Pseudomonas aeruginosa]|uniref:MFS transporter n=1 Tax=Pseudomonas aeruginosa TaxID=287 RepID=UPI0013C44E73|nr:MFS transporter [Pseudomonas aeruginosa]MCM8589400.1 MFS transporter [Pseudomonas aeruginosa]MCM8673311.1 MFS transporter [Pseudomonas aeruginosa]MCP2653258.1 MFS transporter [Pseudomonas aeruginosa]HBO0069513.1 MFS transporter [Pseudomonas aeruginosa]HBO3184467.1 MFS transporter [Pseudomonas aeruginosa]